jgi:hypothetical protein
MKQSTGPLSAAQGITLGCLFSSVIWLGCLNILLLSQHLRF